MKNITIDGRTFQYEIKGYGCGEYGAFIGYETLFYYGTTKQYKKEYILFGKLKVIEKPKFAFKVDRNIENPDYSKEKVRDLIRKELTIFDRKVEIENGEII